MTAIVKRIIGLDQVDIRGKLISIEEQHGSDANFLINTVVSHAIEKDNSICLVLFHNTFGHYHNIGMKLGYNLNDLRKYGVVNVVEPMTTIASNIENIDHDNIDAALAKLNINIPDATKHDSQLVKKLISCLKDKFDDSLKSRKAVTIIVDDLSHLFEFNLSLTDVWFYLRYLRSLIETKPNTSVCLMTHIYKADVDFCQPDMIAFGLKKMADLNVIVEPLTTGHAKDISGKITVMWKTDVIRKIHHWPESTIYHFKLLDRHIKIFSPGSNDQLC
ncbi:hypothetical protein HCN44_005881 [Aphidius gifuensis]|uniref:Elongator complex protein 6 n=1 Tax=Aphidius gifuensis TaxID=684658 RepID=A0A834XVV0_APHGI|nr:elongator complex protein 6 [Aphidius gifuensis]KAF7993100.1 hypothetical protein HCN44_005881 [Aphidius gifuensis]